MTEANNPAAGGCYVRDPVTGELQPAEAPAAPPAPAPLPAEKPPTKTTAKD